MTDKATYITCTLEQAWGVFWLETDRWEIERDDEAGLFDSDAAAIQHIRTCQPCQAKLGRAVLDRTPEGRISVWRREERP